jgi:hypothetical protein
MTKASQHFLHQPALAVSLLALSILVIASPSSLRAQGLTSWRFEIEAGTKTGGKVMLRNVCPQPHRFRVKSNARYLRFEQPVDAILIRSGSIAPIGVLFDATRLESSIYRDTATVECLDCQRDEQCGQEQVELPVEMSVIKPEDKMANETSKSRDSKDFIETRLSPQELLRVTTDRQFKSALEVLESQNETIDMKNVRLLTSRGMPGISEVVFSVTTKGTNEPGEYAKLIYMQQRGERPFVFFDEKGHGAGKLNINWPWKKNPPKGGGGGGGGGGGVTWPTFECTFPAWDEWVTLETPCNNAPVCLYSSKGRYLTETRKGHCSDGSTKTQTRTRFVHCQC